MPDYHNYLVAFEITKENETKSVQLQQQLNIVFFTTWWNGFIHHLQVYSKSQF